MNSLILVLLLSQNIPRHPSPASANGVPIGNGTNWVTNVIPGCFGQNSALGFDGGITCNTIPDYYTWTTSCPGAASCNDGTTGSMLTWLRPQVSGQIVGVLCTALSPGTGTDGISLKIDDGSGVLASCAIPCGINRVGVRFALGDCAGGLPAPITNAKNYRTWYSVDTSCTVPPQGLTCNFTVLSP